MAEELTSVAQFSFLWGSCSRITSCHGAVRWHRRSRRLTGDELTSGPARPPSVQLKIAPNHSQRRPFFCLSVWVGPAAGQEESVSLLSQWGGSRCDRISGCCGCWGRTLQNKIVQPQALCLSRAGHAEGTSALGEHLHFCENKKRPGNQWR